MKTVSRRLHYNDAVDSDVFSFIDNTTSYTRFSNRSTTLAEKKFMDQSTQNSNDLLTGLSNGNELFPVKPREVLFEINANHRKGNLAAKSEQINVNGRILEEFDQPSPGVMVLEKDIQNGIITGFPAVATGGFNMPTNDLINDYEPGDLRKDASLREGYTDNGTFVNIPYIIKYTHEHALPGRTDTNWPVLRYADVLLMLAEAINEQSGPTGQAYAYLNEVRNRAGLSSLSGLNTASFREAVFHERRIELAFENHRWFDVRRQYSNAELVSLFNRHGQDELESPTIDRSGVPFGGNDYDFQEYEILFPIPDSQISLQRGSLRQNPEY